MYDNSYEGRVKLDTSNPNGTADTNEDVLYTYSLPANSLCQNGQGLRIKAGFKNNSSDTITYKLYFGSTSISCSTTTTTGGELELDVMRIGASSQLVVGRGKNNVTPLASAFTAATANDAAAITIKLTETAGASGANATGEYFSVEFLQAP